MPVLGITLRTGLIALNIIAAVVVIGIIAYWVLSVRRSPNERTPQNLADPIPDDVMEGRKLERALRWALLFSVILAVGLPLYWLYEPTRQTAAATGFEERAIERGKVLFSNSQMESYDPTKSLLCANCHGQDAGGGAASFVVTPAAQGNEDARPIQVSWKAPSLNDVFYRFDEEQVNTILVYGRPGTPMPAWGVLGGGPKNDQAISDLIAYLKSIQISPQAAQKKATQAPSKLIEEVQSQLSSAQDNLTAAQATGDATAISEAQFALDRTQARLTQLQNEGEGAQLFETNCARCHTKSWSYFDPSDPKIPDLPPQGSGALGPNLRGGSVLEQFPGLPADDPNTPGFQKQYDWVAIGAPQYKPYGVRGISSGKMAHMGNILSKDQINAIIRYERNL